MANRVFPFAVYATEGGLYTLTTPPTCTVQYAGSAASTITATKRGNGWSVEIDEDQDALLLISGTGIATDAKEILRRQIVAPDNAGIAAIEAKADTVLTRQAQMATITSDFADFAPTAHSLQAIRTRGDNAWLTGSGAAADLAFLPTAATRLSGTAESGTVADLSTVNGTFFATREETTADFINVQVDFAPTAGVNPAAVRVWGYYNGSPTHYINVEAYDFLTETYELVGTMGNQSSVQVYNFPLSPNHIDGGSARVRFFHVPGNGFTSHVLYLDKVEFLAQSAQGIVSANILQVNDAPVTIDDFHADLTALESAVEATQSAVEGLNDFDPATDTVATVTTVTSPVTASVDLSGVATSVWSAAERTLTSGGITAQQVWEYANRTLTSATGGGATAQEVWEYTNRLLTADIPLETADLLATRHGVGLWGAADSSWPVLSEATLDNNGVSLGPLDAADVLVVAQAGGDNYGTRSDGDGGFSLPVPPDATYTIQALRPGFAYPIRTVSV